MSDQGRAQRQPVARMAVEIGENELELAWVAGVVVANECGSKVQRTGEPHAIAEGRLLTVSVSLI
jgi:hypothetical protein